MGTGWQRPCGGRSLCSHARRRARWRSVAAEALAPSILADGAVAVLAPAASVPLAAVAAVRGATLGLGLDARAVPGVTAAGLERTAGAGAAGGARPPHGRLPRARVVPGLVAAALQREGRWGGCEVRGPAACAGTRRGGRSPGRAAVRPRSPLACLKAQLSRGPRLAQVSPTMGWVSHEGSVSPAAAISAQHASGSA